MKNVEKIDIAKNVQRNSGLLTLGQSRNIFVVFAK
jgi:hypothetical protein